MKKCVLFSLLIFGCIAGGFAQQISYGAKAGLNLATVCIKDEDNVFDNKFKMRKSFHLGGFAEVELSERFALQPELLYSSQGFIAEVPDLSGVFGGGDGTREIVYTLNYLALPVMAKYKVIDALSVEGGVQLAYLLGAKSDGNKYESLENFSRLDFGLSAGASYALPLGVFFGGRYYHGLSASKESGANRLFQLSVGYKLK